FAAAFFAGAFFAAAFLAGAFFAAAFFAGAFFAVAISISLIKLQRAPHCSKQCGDSPPDGLPLSGPPRYGERGGEPRASILSPMLPRAADLDLSRQGTVEGTAAHDSVPGQGATGLVLDDARLEKVALLLQVDHFAHPRERVFLVREERLQPDLRCTPV